MKVLVFGNSDTRGLMVAGKTWPQVGCDAAKTEFGSEVELVERGFTPLGDGAPDFAQRIVEEESPDVAIVPLSDFVFLVGLVEEKVRFLFGRRAARFYKRIERRFESATAGRERTANRVNRTGRSIARRLIGARPLTSVQNATATYQAVLRRLARREQLRVVVVAYPVSSTFASESRSRKQDRERFYDAMLSATTEHHFDWLDGDAAIATAGIDAGVGGDSTHLTDTQHKALGDALGRILTASPEEGRPGRAHHESRVKQQGHDLAP